MKDYWNLPENKRGWMYCDDQHLNTEWIYYYDSNTVCFRSLTSTFGLIVANHEVTTLHSVIKNYIYLMQQEKNNLN